MKKLIFISSNIIYKKDLDKLGLKFLSKKFKIILISFKKFKIEKTRTNSNIKFINESNFVKIKKILNNNDIFGLVDLMFPSINSYLIKRYASNKKIKLIKLNNSVFPAKKRNIKEKLLLNFNIFNPQREKIITKIFNHLYLYINSFVDYDYIFICRKADKILKNSKKTTLIKCHGFDYDKFLDLKNKSKNILNKIVYIDNDWLNHPDYKIHNANYKIDKINFKKKMNYFFDLIEKKFNKDILIAANPKSNRYKIKSLFNNRKTYQNKTLELINNCSCVIATKSTALSFAVLLSKPIIFITFDDVIGNELGNGIENQSSLLGKRAINIDRNFLINKKEFTFINKKKYKYYKNNFIKYPGTEKIKSWQIFLNKIDLNI